MSPRALALVMVVASLLLIGATAADWAVVEVDQEVPTDDGTLVVDRTRATSGAEVAGGLLVVGLVGLVGAGLTVRRPILGSVQLPLGALAAVEAFGSLRTLDGATPAPGFALLAGAVLVACGTEAARVGTVGRDPVTGAGQPAPEAARDGAPSRYTVEAAVGDTEDPDDEWDVAVAEQDDDRGTSA